MPPKQEKEETVLLSAKELKNLLGRLQNLENQVADANPMTHLKAKPIDRNTVSVIFCNKMPVVGLVNKGTAMSPNYFWDEQDPVDLKKTIMRADIIVWNFATGKEEVIARQNWNEFLLHCEREECSVIETRERGWKLVQGRTEKAHYEESSHTITGLEKVMAGELAELTVRGKTRDFTVELGSGEKLDIDEKYVNIVKATAKMELFIDDEVKTTRPAVLEN